MKKVFVAIPTFKGKNYCANDFFNNLYMLKILNPNWHFFIADNSDCPFFQEQVKELGFCYIWDEEGSKLKYGREKIVHSRNLLREKFLESKYELFLSLESDHFPTNQLIKKMFATIEENNFKVLGSFYWVSKTKPCAYLLVDKELGYYNNDIDNDHRIRVRLPLPEEILAFNVENVVTGGLGCCLIAREVLEKISFRIKDPAVFQSSDDNYFGVDLRKFGYDYWLDFKNICEHHYLTDGTITGHSQDLFF